MSSRDNWPRTRARRSPSRNAARRTTRSGTWSPSIRQMRCGQNRCPRPCSSTAPFGKSNPRSRQASDDDQLAAIVVDEITVAVAHQEARRPPGLLLGRLESLPNALARFDVEAAQLAVAADAVDVIALDYRRGHQRVQAIGLDLALAGA